MIPAGRFANVWRLAQLSEQDGPVSTRLREWSGDADTEAMQGLASRLWPEGPHPGGLGWSQAIGQLADRVVLAEDGELVGWAGVSQPGSLVLQVASNRADIANELVVWLLQTAHGPGGSIDVFDDVSRRAVVAAGFEAVPTPTSFYGHRDVGLGAAVAQVSGLLPMGYQIRGVRPGEADEQVAVHRSAWRPADLRFILTIARTWTRPGRARLMPRSISACSRLGCTTPSLIWWRWPPTDHWRGVVSAGSTRRPGGPRSSPSVWCPTIAIVAWRARCARRWRVGSAPVVAGTCTSTPARRRRIQVRTAPTARRVLSRSRAVSRSPDRSRSCDMAASVDHLGSWHGCTAR